MSSRYAVPFRRGPRLTLEGGEDVYTTDLQQLRGTVAPARVRSWGAWDHFERNRAGLFVPVDQEDPRRLPGDELIAVDLFAGAGGFSLGLIDAGFHVVAAVEKWSTAAHTYLANLGGPRTKVVFVEDEDREHWHKEFAPKRGTKTTLMRGGPGWQEPAEVVWGDGWAECPDVGGTGYLAHHPEFRPCAVILLGDAKKIDGQDILDAINFATGWELGVGALDLVVGGPPCQGFSTAGRRNVYDDRNSLVFDFVRLVCDLQPKAMAMENVPAIMSMTTPDGENVVDAVTRLLEAGGMGNQQALQRMLEATSGVGVVHNGSRAEQRRRERETEKAAKQRAKKPPPWPTDPVQPDLFSEDSGKSAVSPPSAGPAEGKPEITKK